MSTSTPFCSNTLLRTFTVPLLVLFPAYWKPVVLTFENVEPVAVTFVTALPLATIPKPTLPAVVAEVLRNSLLVTVRVRFEVPELVIKKMFSRESKQSEFVTVDVPVRLFKRTFQMSRASVPAVVALVCTSVCIRLSPDTALPETPSLPKCPVTSTLSSVRPDEDEALTPSAPELTPPLFPVSAELRSVTLVVLLRLTAGPVVLLIVPPEPRVIVPPPCFAVVLPRVVSAGSEAPSPVTVKLPDVFESLIPLVPPLAATLVSDITNGVVPTARVISTAVAPVVATAPPFDVMVSVLSVASNPRCPESGVMSRVPNVIVPELVVRLTPVPPEAVEVVAPKSNAPLEVLTLIPIPPGLVMLVEPLDILPATVVRVTPVVELLVDEML